jgi:hypothetical protein
MLWVLVECKVCGMSASYRVVAKKFGAGNEGGNLTSSGMEIKLLGRFALYGEGGHKNCVKKLSMVNIFLPVVPLPLVLRKNYSSTALLDSGL